MALAVRRGRYRLALGPEFASTCRMERAAFHGVVHPMGGGWEFEHVHMCTFGSEKWTFLLQGSHMHLVVTNPRAQDINSLRNEAYGVARTYVDALAFLVVVWHRKGQG